MDAKTAPQGVTIARDFTFETIRLCLIKVAGRITEVGIKLALATAFPYQAGFTDLAGRIAKLPP